MPVVEMDSNVPPNLFRSIGFFMRSYNFGMNAVRGITWNATCRPSHRNKPGASRRTIERRSVVGSK